MDYEVGDVEEMDASLADHSVYGKGEHGNPSIPSELAFTKACKTLYIEIVDSDQWLFREAMKIIEGQRHIEAV
ncbi:MAG: hypothetical protein MUC41_06215 [Syntrophobacteraceae bacterium]|nr:hypothetical protein [Syntrophobacteraceae bacterium]